MSQALLHDVSRCIGCRGCQVACKQWNDLAAERTRNRGTYENPAALSARTWTRVGFSERRERDGLCWTFTKVQCMHCREPACASVCTVGALRKSARGPVTYDAGRCIGCRYCQYACPFAVPGYEWHEVLGLIGKCDLCGDRTGAGLLPACAKTCPTQAILFGEREDLLAEARRRIRAEPDRYVDHVYGEHEAGGTSVLYVGPVPPEDLGLPALGPEPPARLSESIVTAMPVVLAGLVAALGGAGWLARRRERVREEEAGA